MIPFFHPFLKVSLSERRSRIPVKIWVPSGLASREQAAIEKRVNSLFQNRFQNLIRLNVQTYGNNLFLEESYDELLGGLEKEHEGYQVVYYNETPWGVAASQFQSKLKEIEAFQEKRLFVYEQPKSESFLKVSEVFLPHVNFVGDKSYASVHVVGRGLPNQTFSSEVVVELDGEVLNSKLIEFKTDEDGLISKHFSVDFVFNSVGTHTVDFRLLGVPPFFKEKDLKASLVAFVSYAKTYLLHLAVSPDWTVRFARSYLQASSSIETITYFILRHLNNALDIPTSKLSLIEFPSRELFEEKLTSFHGVFFQNFSFSVYLTPEQMQSLLSYTKNGGRVLQILGPSSYTGFSSAADVFSPCRRPPDWEQRSSPFRWKSVDNDFLMGYEALFRNLGQLSGQSIAQNCQLKDDVQVLAETSDGDPVLVFQHLDDGIVATVLSPDWLDVTQSRNNTHVKSVEQVFDWLMKFLQRRHDASMQPPTIGSQSLSLSDQGLLVNFRGGANTRLYLDLISNDQTLERMVQLKRLKHLDLLLGKLQQPLSHFFSSDEKVSLGWQLSGTKKSRESTWSFRESLPTLINPDVFLDVPVLSDLDHLKENQNQRSLPMSVWLSFFERYPWWFALLFLMLFFERFLSIFVTPVILKKISQN
jgi:hypothetical protein